MLHIVIVQLVKYKLMDNVKLVVIDVLNVKFQFQTVQNVVPTESHQAIVSVQTVNTTICITPNVNHVTKSVKLAETDTNV